MSRSLGALAAAGALALGALASGASSAPVSRCSLVGPFGKGDGQVSLLKPTGPARSIVLFAHGWTAVDPNDWHRVRFDHLCAQGDIVLFPRYQRDENESWQDSVDGFRRGVQLGFRRLGVTHLPVVAAGYSFGGALVNYYAGNARRWKVPVPRSVLSIFPTTRVPGRSAGTPPASVRFVILAGDQDVVVGTEGAKDFMAWLRKHPSARKTYRLIRSNGDFVAYHEAPKEMTAASTRAFWRPIDVLVAGVRK
jgi:acetyl esterase/lipase